MKVAEQARTVLIPFGGSRDHPRIPPREQGMVDIRLGAQRPAFWIASQTVSPLTGMSMCRTPNVESASITAL